MRSKIKVGDIKSIMLGAFSARLVALLIIFIITPDMSMGFLGNTVKQDDVRYEAGAIYYAQNAKRLIDKNTFIEAFERLGDYTGRVSNPFSATPFWYWATCLFVYITKTTISIRIFNITISVLAVWYLYKLVNLNFDRQTAIKASMLLAYLPYPVVFSCFAYKDCLVMFLNIYLIYYASLYRRFHKLKLGQLAFVILATLILMLTRGGLSVILIILCLMLAFFTIKKNMNQYEFLSNIVLGSIAILIAAILALRAMGAIWLRIQSYIIERNVVEGSVLSFLSISKIADIYKLPATYLFATIMPFSLGNPIVYWLDIIGALNLLMVPVSIGSFIDIFKHWRKERILVGICLIYYTLTIIASTGIFRHYYAPLFIPIMLFAHFTTHSSRFEKFLCTIGTFFYTAVLFVYFFH